MNGPDNINTKHRSRAHFSQGLALLMVLWILVLMALMAAAFTRTTRTDTNLARNLIENDKAEALADAGVRLAIWKLMQPVSEGGWTIDGQVHQLILEDGEVRIAISDEAGKIDLNLVSAELLQALFGVLNLPKDEAVPLTDAILDFRDLDHFRQLNGSEDEDYRRAGLPYDAKDGPFQSVTELQQVLGMRGEIYQQIAPLLTVHSHRSTPNSTTAPQLVRAALTRLSSEVADSLGRSQTVSNGPGNDNVDGGFRSRLRLYAIHAEGRSVGEAIFVREAVVRIMGRPNSQFQVLEWRRGSRELFAGWNGTN